MYDFAGVRDNEGDSPLDITMKNIYIGMDNGDDEGHPELAYYLLSHDTDNEEAQTKLLFIACGIDKLNIVKGLVEEHKLDPKSELLCVNTLNILVHVYDKVNVHYLLDTCSTES